MPNPEPQLDMSRTFLMVYTPVTVRRTWTYDWYHYHGNGYRRVAWAGPYGLPVNRKRLSAMSLCLIHVATNKLAIISLAQRYPSPVSPRQNGQTQHSLTSCRRAAATICPAPLLPLWAPKRLAPPSWPRLQSADRNVTVGSYGQYVPTLTAAAAWRVNAAVSKAAWWPWPFDLESGSRVTCDVGYICANFSLSIGLSVLDLGPMYATDRQTSDSIIA